MSQVPGHLMDLLERISDANRLDTPREPGKWTPRFISHHLADVEALQTKRYLDMLCNDDAIIVPVQQELWAANAYYATRDPMMSALAFGAMRARNVEMLAQLTPEQQQRQGTHPIRGVFTIEKWVEFVAKHDENHIIQLEGTLDLPA
jgi:DinB superfamily